MNRVDSECFGQQMEFLRCYQLQLWLFKVDLIQKCYLCKYEIFKFRENWKIKINGRISFIYILSYEKLMWEISNCHWLLCFTPSFLTHIQKSFPNTNHINHHSKFHIMRLVKSVMDSSVEHENNSSKVLVFSVQLFLQIRSTNNSL